MLVSSTCRLANDRLAVFLFLSSSESSKKASIVTKRNRVVDMSYQGAVQGDAAEAAGETSYLEHSGFEMADAAGVLLGWLEFITAFAESGKQQKVVSTRCHCRSCRFAHFTRLIVVLARASQVPAQTTQWYRYPQGRRTTTTPKKT